MVLLVATTAAVAFEATAGALCKYNVDNLVAATATTSAPAAAAAAAAVADVNKNVCRVDDVNDDGNDCGQCKFSHFPFARNNAKRREAAVGRRQAVNGKGHLVISNEANTTHTTG